MTENITFPFACLTTQAPKCTLFLEVTPPTFHIFLGHKTAGRYPLLVSNIPTVTHKCYVCYVDTTTLFIIFRDLRSFTHTEH